VERELKVICPPNYGWIQTKLTTDELDYLWSLIKTNGKDPNTRMQSQTNGCYQLIDTENFYEKTLKPLISIYEEQFGNELGQVPVKDRSEYFLSGLWVNYQMENDFFPLHSHNGVYSFVVWMKIPTNFNDQIKNKVKLDRVLFDGLYTSNFSFNYTDILGKNTTYEIEMSSEMEGILTLFPSKLQHQVYPFYNCSEERISVSGNISINNT
jgi:hypothetical protein